MNNNMKVKLRPRKKLKYEGFDARINFPGLRLNLKSKEPVASLKELNKVLYSLRVLSYDNCEEGIYPSEDDQILFRLGYISDGIKNNQQGMEFIKKALRVEESCRVKKISLEETKIIDFNSNQYNSKLDLSKARQKINNICKGMERANYALVHVEGALEVNENEEILDLFRNRLPNSEIKVLFSQKDMLGKTVIETIFFGSFEDELW